MIEILHDEIQICMRLLGVTNFEELTPNYLIKDTVVSYPTLTSSFPLIDEGY